MGKQQSIKGAEAESDKHMKLTEKEVEAKGALTDLMKQHKVKRHVEDGYIIELVPKDEKLKVRRIEEEGEGD